MKHIIHIQWEGPFTQDQISLLNNESSDYGIYQIYGTHPIYGSDVLLYIGQAGSQTFATRLKQHKWVQYTPNPNELKYYVGRISGEKTPKHQKWAADINLSEQLLIYSHAPALNSQNLNSIKDEDCKDVHVLNWGMRKDLLPEVSGARYTTLYGNLLNYASFGSHI